MQNESQRPRRVSRQGEGMGAPSPDMVEERAREIALTQDRSADEVTDADREQARLELENLTLPKATFETGRAEATVPRNPGDETIYTQHQVPKHEPVDEQTLPELETLEGVEEAEHDRELQARQKSDSETETEEEFEERDEE